MSSCLRRVGEAPDIWRCLELPLWRMACGIVLGFGGRGFHHKLWFTAVGGSFKSVPARLDPCRHLPHAFSYQMHAPARMHSTHRPRSLGLPHAALALRSTHTSVATMPQSLHGDSLMNHKTLTASAELALQRSLYWNPDPSPQGEFPGLLGKSNDGCPRPATPDPAVVARNRPLFLNAPHES